MEGQDHLRFWDIVNRYPFGTLVISLSLIWSVERIVKAIVSRKCDNDNKGPPNDDLNAFQR